MTDDEREIRGLVEAWMAATRAGDLEAALTLMTDDVVFLTPTGAPFGKEGFADRFRRMGALKIDVEAEIEELELFADRAILRNRLRLTLTRDRTRVGAMAGHTMSVLHKGRDGRWRIARDANLVSANPP